MSSFALFHFSGTIHRVDFQEQWNSSSCKTFTCRLGLHFEVRLSLSLCCQVFTHHFTSCQLSTCKSKHVRKSEFVSLLKQKANSHVQRESSKKTKKIVYTKKPTLFRWTLRAIWVSAAHLFERVELIFQCECRPNWFSVFHQMSSFLVSKHVAKFSRTADISGFSVWNSSRHTRRLAAERYAIVLRSTSSLLKNLCHRQLTDVICHVVALLLGCHFFLSVAWSKLFTLRSKITLKFSSALNSLKYYFRKYWVKCWNIRITHDLVTK